MIPLMLCLTLQEIKGPKGILAITIDYKYAVLCWSVVAAVLLIMVTKNPL